jgi:hypothetical protein
MLGLGGPRDPPSPPAAPSGAKLARELRLLEASVPKSSAEDIVLQCRLVDHDPPVLVQAGADAGLVAAVGPDAEDKPVTGGGDVEVVPDEEEVADRSLVSHALVPSPAATGSAAGGEDVVVEVGGLAEPVRVGRPFG